MNKISRNGFTLLEVLIGLSILAIGILAIAGMYITSIKGTAFSKNLTQASFLVQQRIEFLKGLPINDSRLDTGDYQNEIVIDGYRGSYKTIRNTNFVVIRYTVSWIENGVTHNVSFSALKSR